MKAEDALQEIHRAAKAGRSAALAGANLKGAVLPGAILKEADLQGANLYGANLKDANLTGANLRKADLREADLMGARMERADLRQVFLFEASLRGAEAPKADLREAILIDADLRDVDFSDADLRGVQLGTINPIVSDLTGSVLGGADLRDAKGIVRLPVGHPEGYDPVAVWRRQDWWIGAGCWFFTLAEAREHWGPSYQGERWLGDRYLKALDILAAEAQFWLEKWGIESSLNS